MRNPNRDYCIVAHKVKTLPDFTHLIIMQILKQLLRAELLADILFYCGTSYYNYN